MATQPTMQEQRSEQKKQHIYEVAMGLFQEYGYEKTTIREICQAAGVTNSSFYNFFGDKNGILLRLLYQVLEESIACLEPTEEHLQNPYQAICDFFVESTLALGQFNKEVARETIQSTGKLLSGSYQTLSSHSAFDQITDLLTSAKEKGYIPADTDCRQVAEYLFVSANGVQLYWLTYSGRSTYKSIAKRLLPTAFSAVTDLPVVVK